MRSTLTPLFSPSNEIVEGEGGHRCQTFFPSAVFTTADYSFRKERWYGLKEIGMLFRWNMFPSSGYNNNHNNDEYYDSNDRSDDNIPLQQRTNGRRIFSLPTTLDITAGRSIPPYSTGNQNAETVFIDSGNLRIGWQKNNDYDDMSDTDDNQPWIQIGFDPNHSTSNNASIDVKRRNVDRPFHLGFFLPLIRRRFDLQWTSRWNYNTNVAATTRSSSMNIQPNDDPWWIPQVELDPSMGTLSSENRYRNAYVGKDDRKYWMEYKLRLRTTVPTLLSSGMTASDGYDDDLQTASLRLDCSLITNPGETKREFLGPSVTTARLDMTVVPSCWWRSVTETARLGLIHEQNHAVNQ